MLIKGGSRCSIKFWSKHLEDAKTNERVDLIEKRGLAAVNLAEMLEEIQGNASHLTRCKNFMYIASFNPREGEALTEQQWDRAYEIFEQERGIPEGQARIVYEHEKHGRIHRHVVWDRIDQEKQRAFPDGLDMKVCEAAKHKIEAELSLQKTPGLLKRDPELPPPERRPKAWETFRGMKSGINPLDVKAQVTAIFKASDHAANFAAGLHANGYLLCIGERRAFVILDQAGHDHSLARRLDGVTTKQLHGFMQTFNRDSLPTVAQARVQFQERKLAALTPELADVQKAIAEQERDSRPEKAGQQEKNLKGTPAHISKAAQESDSPKAFAAALAEKGVMLSTVTKAEAERSRTDATAAKEQGQYAPIYREGEIVAINQRGYVYRLSERTTGTDFQAMQRYLRTLDRSTWEGIDATRQVIQIRATERDSARTITSNHRHMGKDNGAIGAAGAVLNRGMRQGLSIVGGGMSAFVRAFESLLSPVVPMTRQQAATVREENERIAHADAREAAAKNRWLDYTDEHEQITAKMDAQAREAQQRDDQHRRLQRDRGEGRERER